jgi:hypothetical protein
VVHFYRAALGWTVFTLYVWIASLKVNKAIFVTFTVFLLTLSLLALGFLLAIPGLVVVSGYAGIILALCAWYTSAAGIINLTFGRIVLPLGAPFGEPQLEPASTPAPERTAEHTGQVLPQDLRHPLTDTPPFASDPTPEPAAQTPPERITEKPTPPAVTAQESITEQPPGMQLAKDTQPETEEIVVQDTEETEGSTQENERESIRSSEVGDQEAPQTGTPASPEIRAGSPELPIKDYDSLSVVQITRRLSGLSIEELERLRDYEAENKNRRLLAERFEKRIRVIRKAGTPGEVKGTPPEKTRGT